MYKIRPFDRAKDLSTVNRWLDQRGEKIIVDFVFYPPTAFMVTFKEIPVCCGFMIKCDNQTVINDSFMSDPTAPQEIRNAAVIRLRNSLAIEAGKFGAKYIIAPTSQPKLVPRLEAQGFKIIEENITQLGRLVWP